MISAVLSFRRTAASLSGLVRKPIYPARVLAEQPLKRRVVEPEGADRVDVIAEAELGVVRAEYRLLVTVARDEVDQVS